MLAKGLDRASTTLGTADAALAEDYWLGSRVDFVGLVRRVFVTPRATSNSMALQVGRDAGRGPTSRHETRTAALPWASRRRRSARASGKSQDKYLAASLASSSSARGNCKSSVRAFDSFSTAALQKKGQSLRGSVWDRDTPGSVRAAWHAKELCSARPAVPIHVALVKRLSDVRSGVP